MKFNKPAEVESVAWQLKRADYPRGKNRARINDLFNGAPPYDQQEVEENNIAVNVNFLESTRLGHDARSQFYNAFTKPGNYFTLRTDIGPIHKRNQWGAIVTREINRIMKRSINYFETMRSKFAMDVLHGIAPSIWRNRTHWCPDGCGVEDVLIPATTRLDMHNLPFFALYKQFTAPELIRLTRGPKVDPGWDRGLVDSCIEWVDRSSMALLGVNWPEIWAPEKLSERIKGDGGFYVGDQVPTVNCFDFFFWDDSGKESGWRRRIMLDSWSTPDGGGTPHRREGEIYQKPPAFLYTSGAKPYAAKREEIVAFQFADLSAVAPFRYHSVRSLGFLLYAVCHLQNRLRCRFNEAVFEALMMYFRVKTMDDAQRALKLELVNRGFIEEGINPIPANERYQVNAPLVQLGLVENKQLISENAASYTQNTNYSQGGVEKTRFQVMAETNSVASLVSAGLNQAYAYQTFEYLEILRRFCKQGSPDPDVNKFQAACLRQGVPQDMLCEDYWDLEPERVMGAGNKTLEMTIAQQLMEWRDKFDPEPQRTILRDSVLAITDDPAKALSLVPEKPVKVTDSVHDAQLASGSLMMGLPVEVKTGINHIEYVDTLLLNMAVIMKGIEQTTKMGTPDQIKGLLNIAGNISDHIKIIAQDEKEKPRVKKYQDQLAKMMNMVKAYAQRQQQAMQKQAQAGNGGMDPEKLAKMQAEMMLAQQKKENARTSHAEKTAQRRITFEQQTKQKAEQHALEMRSKAAQAELEIRKTAEENRLDLEREEQKLAAQRKAQRESSEE